MQSKPAIGRLNSDESSVVFRGHRPSDIGQGVSGGHLNSEEELLGIDPLVGCIDKLLDSHLSGLYSVLWEIDARAAKQNEQMGRIESLLELSGPRRSIPAVGVIASNDPIRNSMFGTLSSTDEATRPRSKSEASSSPDCQVEDGEGPKKEDSHDNADSTQHGRSRESIQLEQRIERSEEISGMLMQSSKKRKEQIWKELSHYYSLGWRKGIAEFCRSSFFDVFWMIIICANAVYVGVVLQLEAETDADPTMNLVGEIVFTSLFLIEIVIRTSIEGPRQYFCGNDWSWAYFDVSIVALSLMDLVMLLSKLTLHPIFDHLAILRMLRCLRVQKIIRAIRFLRELRLLIQGIFSSMKAIGWTIVLLLLVSYLCALVLLQLLVTSVKDENAGVYKGTAPPGWYFSHFGNLQRCMVTLLQVMSGDSWLSAVGRTLYDDDQKIAACVLIFYWMFTALGILNIVTGIFVEQTVSAAQTDSEVVKEREAKERAEILRMMFSSFTDVDSDGDHLLSQDEFEALMQSDDIQERFRALNIQTSDAKVLFAMCDINGDGVVTLDEFIKGCQSCMGFLKPLDFYKIALRHKRALRATTDVVSELYRLVHSRSSKNGVGVNEAITYL